MARVCAGREGWNVTTDLSKDQYDDYYIDVPQQVDVGQPGIAFFVINIKSPINALDEDNFNLQIVGESLHDPSSEKTKDVIYDVKQVYELAINTSTIEIEMDPGEKERFSINVKNIGNGVDTIYWDFELTQQRRCQTAQSVRLPSLRAHPGRVSTASHLQGLASVLAQSVCLVVAILRVECPKGRSFQSRVSSRRRKFLLFPMLWAHTPL